MDSQTGPDHVFEDLRRFGDRSSSFMTLYPGFRSFRADPGGKGGQDGVAGQIRFAETRGAWVAGTEPLAPQSSRAGLFERFDAEAASRGKHPIMTPVTERLSRELVERGYHRIQVGSEPVFELRRYFDPAGDQPLDLFPHARALLKRGYRVREIPSGSLDASLRGQLDGLVEAWKSGRATVPLSFLNQIDPWRHGEHKKLFVVEQGRKALAFLSAVPIFARNGYFFADYIRAPGSKAGTVELLFIEAMRALHDQGCGEVRLGMCPLARLEPAYARSMRERLSTRVLGLVFRFSRFPMSFRSIFEFKAKFRPTSWEPLFLVSRGRPGWSTLSEVCRVHFPESVTRAYAVSWGRRLKRQLDARVPIRALPESRAELLARTRVTLSFSAVFVALHALRTALPAVDAIYRAHPFTPSAYSPIGHFLAPLFHNTHYHFGGDVPTFLVFAGLVELLLGARFCLMVVAAGLWASNPLTWAAVEAVLRPLSAVTYSRFLAETDYGSSNAVYAAVGALAPILARPGWLLTPFALNGIFLCFAHQSWLSLHHLIALGCGYTLTRAFSASRAGK